jgi:hypothetical protein
MKRVKTLLAGMLFVASLTANAEEAAAGKEITVYRSPTCGCCENWIDHLKEKNYVIKDIVSDEMDDVKDKYGVPGKLRSCHTAVVDGYVIEGHVPAADIDKLLHDKPKVKGIAVPGMPAGSPGMEMGNRHDDFEVMSFDDAGNVAVFATHEDGN